MCFRSFNYICSGRRRIKELLAAYLDPNLQREDIPTGVSFASGGSGCAPLTPTAFLISASSSDILRSYPSFIRKFQYDFPSYAALLVRSASTFVKDLYSLVTTRFGFFSAVAIGCTPLERSSTGLLRECFKLQNQRAELFNSMLSTELDYINANFTDAKLDSKLRRLAVVVLEQQKWGYSVTKKSVR
ncbi:hypothetical protein ACFX15_001023 [Malus domestica]